MGFQVMSIWPQALYILKVCGGAILVYAVFLSLHRLLASPIAQVPGPKLAAISGWIETYYDVFMGGKFIFKLEEWHKQYGPIIRIGPNEVHIADPEYYDELYSTKSRHDKIQAWKYRFGLPNCVNDTIPHHVHRRRRMAIGPFFSRQNVLDFSPFIQECVDRLCGRMFEEFASQQKPLCLDSAYASLTSEIIMYYSFGIRHNFIDYPDFKTPFTTAIERLAASLHMSGHFPWTLSLIKSIPRPIARWLSPHMDSVLSFHGEIRKRIECVISEAGQEPTRSSRKTVFHDLLHSTFLLEEEKTVEILKDEAAGLTGAGIETSKRALAIASFFVLENPRVYAKLRRELLDKIPDPTDIPKLPVLESFPYLSAVINEALRLSPGISQRLSRTNPTESVVYGMHVIPPGTRFAMSNWLQQRDLHIFPDPDVFRPERWLEENIENGQQKPLSKYSFPFGKGPRMCLGFTLAWAELFIVLTTIFRRVDMSLFDTDRAAVDMEHDLFIPFPKKGSQG
ncbi:cytochrome P450 [Colletotrichum asianum]